MMTFLDNAKKVEPESESVRNKNLKIKAKQKISSISDNLIE